MAKNLYGYDNIRILSLGSTHQPFEMFKPSAFSDDSKYIERGAMTDNMMAYTTDYFVSFNDFYNLDTSSSATTNKYKLSNDFIRVDGIGKAGVDGRDASTKNIAALKAIGATVWSDNSKDVMVMLQAIIDEKAVKEGWKKRTAK